MHELVNSLEELKQKLVDLRVMLRLEQKKKEIAILHEDVNQPNFWNDQETATKKSKRLGFLEQEQIK